MSKKVQSSRFFPIDKILKTRIRNGKPEYLIKWKGYTSDSNSWEPESCLQKEPQKGRIAKKTATKATARVAARTIKKRIATTSEDDQFQSPSKITPTSARTAAESSDKTLAQNKRAKESAELGADHFYEIERILAKRTTDHTKQVEYLVHWKGYDVDESTWEPEDHLKSDYCQIYCDSIKKAFLD